MIKRNQNNVYSSIHLPRINYTSQNHTQRMDWNMSIHLGEKRHKVRILPKKEYKSKA